MSRWFRWLANTNRKLDNFFLLKIIFSLYFLLCTQFYKFFVYFQRTINVSIGQEQRFVEPKVRTKQEKEEIPVQYSYGDVNDQQNLENLAAIAFLESEMSQAAKLLTMPFINK